MLYINYQTRAFRRVKGNPPSAFGLQLIEYLNGSRKRNYLMTIANEDSPNNKAGLDGANTSLQRSCKANGKTLVDTVFSEIGLSMVTEVGSTVICKRQLIGNCHKNT